MTREEYYKTHRYCPVCGQRKLKTTLIGVVEREGKPFEDDVNRVGCRNCNWSGKVSDLVSEEE